MANEPQELIHPGDFKSVALRIALFNASNSLEIEGGRRFYHGTGGKRIQKSPEGARMEVKLCEFIEDGFVLQVPSDTCERGHHLRLTIETVNAPAPIRLEAEAEVRKVERNDALLYSEENRVEHHAGSLDSVNVRLTRFDEGHWSALRELFGSRQREIEEFFKAVRGW